MIDMELFNKIPDGTVFLTGLTINDPNGVYMTNNRLGDLLMFVAKKGYGHDWTLYFGWMEMGADYIAMNGDKSTFDENIRRCVNVTEDVFKLYRA